jgi:hypothetical protein
LFQSLYFGIRYGDSEWRDRRHFARVFGINLVLEGTTVKGKGNL